VKIVFLSAGAREKALRGIVEAGEQVSAVITPYLSDSNRRFEGVINTALEYGIPVYPVRRNGVFDAVRKAEADILISCGFSFILDEEVISSVKYAINVHPTLLPKYRGYRSGPHVILNGEKKTGVTVHFLTPEMDRGDILAQQEFEVTAFDTVKSISRKYQELEPSLLVNVLKKLKAGRLEAVPQNENKATEYLEMRTPEHSLIDPKCSIEELWNEIRASDPVDYPAHFYVEGQKVCIRVWRPEKPDEEEDLI